MENILKWYSLIVYRESLTYILDEDNMIVDKGLSGDILREKIGELLKKNK